MAKLILLAILVKVAVSKDLLMTLSEDLVYNILGFVFQNLNTQKMTSITSYVVGEGQRKI